MMMMMMFVKVVVVTYLVDVTLETLLKHRVVVVVVIYALQACDAVIPEHLQGLSMLVCCFYVMSMNIIKILLLFS